MGLNDLCQECRRFAEARFIKVQGATPKSKPHSWAPIDERDESEISQAESQFRRLWPTRRLLEPKFQTDRDDGQLLLKCLADIHREAAAGCHLCHVILARQWMFDRFPPELAPHVFGLPLFNNALSCITWCFRIDRTALSEARRLVRSTGLSSDVKTDVVFRMHTKINDISFGRQITVDQAEDAISSADAYFGGIRAKTAVRIKDWLAECTSRGMGHEKLCTNKTLGDIHLPLPTRLLKLENRDKDRCSVRLIETHSLAMGQQSLMYATLSYCWGDGVPSKLTTGNYDKWTVEIPQDELSKTFRDAFIVARALDIEYLWIDALCIIQDSTIDWNREAPRMWSVFAGGLVTLAASASTDGQGGLFVQRDLPYTCTLFFGDGHRDVTDENIDDGTDQPVRFEKMMTISSATSKRRLYIQHISSAPLNSRAWVMQEKLLTLRTIHFTNSEIWWQCPSATDKETWVPWNDKLYSDNDTLALQNADWTGLVKIYSRRKLTYPKDRLPGFAAIAETYCQQHKLDPSTYYAGLWGKDLLSNLMWRLEDRSSLPYAPNTEAPSWSWASQDGSIWFGSTQDYSNTALHEAVSVARVDVQLQGSNAFGPIHGAKLYLDTTVLKVVDCVGRTITLETRDGTEGCYALEASSNQDPVYRWPPGDASASDSLLPTHAVPLTHGWDPQPKLNRLSNVPGGEWYHEHVFGLLLLRAVDGQVGTYKRVDAWWIGKTGQATDRPRWWTEGAILDATSYVHDLGSGRYQIAII